MDGPVRPPGGHNPLDRFEAITVPRILVAGTHRGAGVSTVVLGLLSQLRAAGVNVASTTIDTSLVTATHHRRICRRLTHSLDTWMLTREQCQASFARAASGAELVLIEGEHALFDERPGENCFESVADIAVGFRAPVVLVIDAAGFAESAGAVVSGFERFRADIKLAGVIANRVRNTNHNDRLKRTIEELLGVPYLGGVPRGDLFQVGGKSEPNSSLLSRDVIQNIAELIGSSIDLSRFREIAEQAGAISVHPDVLSGSDIKCRIAVADDVAFHLTIQDNLDLLRRAGAELVGFSPVADTRLPMNIAGVYLPGGYVHLYGAELQSNRAMIESLREFTLNGGLLYGEGGAAAYLCDRIHLPSGQSFRMAGILPCEATAVIENNVESPLRHCEALATQDCLIASSGARVRGMNDLRWVMKVESEIPRCFQLVEPEGERKNSAAKSGKRPATTSSGFTPTRNILVSTFHAHWGSSPLAAERFVSYASSVSTKGS